MGRRELGDYRGKFNRKRGLTHIHASTGVAAFLFLKDIGQLDNYSHERHEVSRGKLLQIDRFATFRALFAVGLAGTPALGPPEPLSLERNAITRSPAHCRQFRLIMIYCRSGANNSLVTIVHSRRGSESFRKCRMLRETRGDQKKQTCSKLNISAEWPGVS
jgi:hypothetical protein